MSRWNAFFESLPAERVSEGTRITHLIDDDRIVETLWTTLDEARRRIWVSIYILTPDPFGRETLTRLVRAARRGCEVRLICDSLGSWELREHMLAPLRRAGGRVAFFNPIWPIHTSKISDLRHLGLRNHRKLFIIDGEQALCGGFNLSEFYAGVSHGAWLFDDTMTLLEGPCAQDLGSVFRRTWREITGEELSLPPCPAPHPEGCTAAALETDPRRDNTCLGAALAEAINRADDHCYFVTPYFIPTPVLYKALLDAGRRGVDVRVLTAGDTDRPVARWAGWHRYEELLDSGLRIFEMEGRILHSKTVAIDGVFGTIGSYNMDAWTDRHTLDLNILFANDRVARSLELEFSLGVRDAREITPSDVRQRDRFHRLLHRLTYQAYCRL